MDLVKIGNEYVNPEQVVNVSYSRNMDGDKYVVSVYLTNGKVVKEVVKQNYAIHTVIERLTTMDIKIYAKRIKNYCEEHDNCDTCVYKDRGCFIFEENGSVANRPEWWNVD